MVTGFRALSTYWLPAARFDCDVIYTNKPVPGAFRGYGAPQALFGLEQHMEEMALASGIDPVEFKRKNWVKEGQALPMAVAMGEGREGFPQTVQSNGLDECVEAGATSIEWTRRNDPEWKAPPDRPNIRRGIGLAICMHGTGIAGWTWAPPASNSTTTAHSTCSSEQPTSGPALIPSSHRLPLKPSASPSSKSSSTAAIPTFTPFDTGRLRQQYHLHLRWRRAEGSRRRKPPDSQPRRRASARWRKRRTLWLENKHIHAPDGRSVSLEKLALHSIHQEEQHQIMATASHMSYVSPPPFAAQYAALEVDTETGQVTVEKAVMAVDCGVAINPVTASGQVEGGMTQALGYALCEEMPYDEKGRLQVDRFGDYRILAADEMPLLDTILIQTYEPTGPFGAKAVAEIPMDGMAPAIASAIFDATGVRIREIPFTPERVWRALRDS